MTPNLWRVTLRADGGTYRHLIVSDAPVESVIDCPGHWVCIECGGEA